MKQKLGITIVFAIMAFVTVSCSALWRVDNSASISFSLSKEALTAMSLDSNVRNIDSSNGAVLATISLYKESGSLIDSENVILENDEAVTVEFVEIPIIGENVYAKIEAAIDGVQYEGISETKKMIAEGNTLHISSMNPVIKMFILTFDANGGTVDPTSKTVTEGTAIGDLPTPVNEATPFLYWQIDETPISSSAIYAYGEDKTAEAVWGNVETFTVNFNPNGGSFVNSINVEHGLLIEKPADPTRENYSFSGWYTDESLTIAWDFTNDTVTSKITLYAKWTANTYTLTFNANGGTVNPESKIVTDGMPIGDLPTPSKTASIFSAWQIDGISISSDTVFEYGEDKEAIAVWDAKTYTVSFESNGGSGLDAITAIEDTKIAKPVSPEKEKHIFNGWYRDELLTTPWNFDTNVVTSDMTLYAKWEAVLNVYLDGKEGDNINSGLDVVNVVKTFDKAVSLLSEGGTIWVIDTVTVNSGAQIWQKPIDWTTGELTIKRYDTTTAPDKTGVSFPEDLINVTGGTLTLQNITIDGQGGINSSAGNVNASGSLIRVSGGSLILETGAELQNNNTDGDGGAIYTEGNVRIPVNSYSNITNNKATNGGGVYVAGGTFTLSGGTISNNNATIGAGVYIGTENSAMLKLSGEGVISSNSTDNIYYTNTVSSSPVKIIGELGNVKYLNPKNTSAGYVVVEEYDSYEMKEDEIGLLYVSDSSGNNVDIAFDDGKVVIPPDALASTTKNYYVSESGKSWGNGSEDFPFDNVQAAVDAIIAGNDETSEYTINIIGTITKEGVDIVGGPSDSNDGMVEIVESNKNLKITLKGDDNKPGIIDALWRESGSNGLENRVLYVSGESKNITVTLSGNLTITGGYTGSGSGINIKDANLKLGTGVSITGNHAVNVGGGIYIGLDGNVEMSGGSITNNTSSGKGGGININNTDATLKLEGNPIISGNTASGEDSNVAFFNSPTASPVKVTNELTDGADIRLSPEYTTGVILVETTNSVVIDKSKFTLDNNTGGKTIDISEGNLILN